MAKRAHPGVAIVITPELSVREAVRRLIRAYSARLHAAERKVRSGRSPAALHALRMAVRRVRNALKCVRKHDVDARRIERALAKVSRSMGVARDWDIFVGITLPAVLKRAEMKVPEIVYVARRERDFAWMRLRKLLASPLYATLHGALAAWLETPARCVNVTPGGKFACKRVRRLQQQLLACARGLSRQSYARQHDIRKLARRLRYTVEGFTGYFTQARHTNRYLRYVKTVQDALGETHDAAQGVEKFRQLRAPAAVMIAARRHLEITASENEEKARHAVLRLRHRKYRLHSL